MITDVLISRLPELIAIALLLCVSIFMSATETALFSLTPEELRRLSLESRRSSRDIISLLRDPATLLAAVLLGNMLANVAIYSLSILVSLHLSKVSGVAAGLWGAFSLLTVIVLAETLPKGISVSHPVGVAHLVATPFRLYYAIVNPFARLLRYIAEAVTDYFSRHLAAGPNVTADELKLLVGMAEKEGELSSRTRGMIEQVIELASVRISEIMVPRVDVAFHNMADPVDSLVAMIRRDRPELVLACEGTRDNVIGGLRPREVLLHPDANIRSRVRPVRFVPETVSVEVVLRQMDREGMNVAVVVDEFGGTAGVVTREHVLKEIVGEIGESREEVAPVQMIDEDTYLMAGDLSAREWRPLLKAGFDPAGAETVGGFVMSLLSRVPREGDAVEYRGLLFMVEKMSGRRILSVRVHRIRAEESE